MPFYFAGLRASTLLSSSLRIMGLQLRILARSCTLDSPMSRFRRSLAVSACATACVVAAAASLWSPGARLYRGDRNVDKPLNIWRTDDRQDQVSEVAIDTNSDGRTDVREYYERGVLVRRESDRDLNDRVDLVQEFDPTTSQPTRSVVDVDFDGTADLLVLFRDE